MLLPKRMYQFRTITLPLPKSLYIWNGEKKAKCLSTIVSLPKIREGLDFPSIMDYHRAVILDQIKYWWRPTTDKTWSDPKRFLLTDESGYNPPKGNLLTYEAMIKVWRDIALTKTGDMYEKKVLVPQTALQVFIPTLKLTNWLTSETPSLTDISSQAKIRDFNVLRDRVGLVNLIFTLFFKLSTSD